MNFDKFVKDTKEALQEKMGQEYTLSITNVTKNNNIHLTGIVITRQSNNVSPTIYLNSFYEEYNTGRNVEVIVEEIYNIYTSQAKEIAIDMDFYSEYAGVKDRIYCKLIHFSKNMELLKDVPHFKWNDLAIVFYYAMDVEELGKASILIRKDHQKRWNQESIVLYNQAIKNTKRDMGELLIPMKEILKDMTGVAAVDDLEIPMYVLTNKEKTYGSAAMIYSEELKKLATTTEKNLIILPSSVHEVIVLPDDGTQDYEFYRNMVREVNETQVAAEEVLSDSIYRYIREKEVIEEIIS